MTLIFLDSEADHVGFDFFEGAHVAAVIGHRYAFGEGCAGEFGGRVGRRPGCGRQSRLEPFDDTGDLRKVGDAEYVAIAQNNGAENGVFQLPDIAGPIIGAQHGEGVGFDAGYVLAFLQGEPPDEIVGKAWNVFAAIADGRYVNREDVEAVV